MSKPKKEPELKADDFLNQVPAELRALLEQIDIESEDDHEHGPGCGHHHH